MARITKKMIADFDKAIEEYTKEMERLGMTSEEYHDYWHQEQIKKIYDDFAVERNKYHEEIKWLNERLLKQMEAYSRLLDKIFGE